MTKKFTVSEEDKRLFKETIANIKPLSSPKTRQKSVVSNEDPNFAYRRYQASHSMPDNKIADNVKGEEKLYFCRPNVNEKKLQKLQAGLFNKSHCLDLHGLTEDEAIKQLHDFIYAASRRKIEMVVIVHGKGSRHGGALPILKNSVNQLLRQLDNVLAFCSARQEDGGSGAVYVLLQS
jgi:DNA-nicking Smr family endonuclease